jgi:hypothetical protein
VDRKYFPRFNCIFCSPMSSTLKLRERLQNRSTVIYAVEATRCISNREKMLGYIRLIFSISNLFLCLWCIWTASLFSYLKELSNNMRQGYLGSLIWPKLHPFQINNASQQNLLTKLAASPFWDGAFQYCRMGVRLLHLHQQGQWARPLHHVQDGAPHNKVVSPPDRGEMM